MQDDMIFSATRITLWLQCKRAWAFKYILKLEPPAAVWHDLGGEVHRILEVHVKNGTEIDRTSVAGNLAGKIAPYVTPWVKHERALPEVSFTLKGKHADWRGFKDLEIPPSEGRIGEIIDYKTAGDLSYAKTSDSLALDPQAILYAEDHFRRFMGDVVRLSWLYVGKKKPFKFLPVHAVMTRAYAAAGFAALDSFAAEAKALDVKTESDILQLEGTYSHCKAYGGCPYRSNCGRLFVFE